MSASLYMIPVALVAGLWGWQQLRCDTREWIIEWALLALMVSAGIGVMYAVLTGAVLHYSTPPSGFY